MAPATALRIVPRNGLCEDCKVRNVSACAALSDSELEKLAAITTTKDLAPGQTLYEEGDAPGHIFNLTEGMVRLVKLLPNGRRQIVGFVFPGDMLGLAPHGLYTASAEAITPVKVCRFPREKLLGLMDDYPRLKSRLLDIAADELGQAQDQMLLLGRKSPLEKVASFLQRLRGETCRSGGDISNNLDLAMGRSDIADYLGLTIETVSRTFTKLKKDGLIALEGAHHVVIRDEEALEELAEAWAES